MPQFQNELTSQKVTENANESSPAIVPKKSNETLLLRVPGRWIEPSISIATKILSESFNRGGDNRYMKRAKAILRCALCSEMAEHGGVGSASEPHTDARYWVGDCCIQANKGDMGRVTNALNEKFKKKKD